MSWNPELMRIGCGEILKDGSDYWILGITWSHGTGTSILAEILALELGLQHAWDIGHRDVVCCTGCPNVVRVLHSNVCLDSLWAREEVHRVREMM